MLYTVKIKGEYNTNVAEFFGENGDEARRYYNNELLRLKNKFKSWEKEVNLNSCRLFNGEEEIILEFDFFEEDQEIVKACENYKRNKE